jgi:hypothetical protein
MPHHNGKLEETTFEEMGDSLTRPNVNSDLSNQLPKFRVPQLSAFRSFDELHSQRRSRLHPDALAHHLLGKSERALAAFG